MADTTYTLRRPGLDDVQLLLHDNGDGTYSLGGVLSAGSAVVGKVGIDQTAPGTTNGVQAANPLTATAATIANGQSLTAEIDLGAGRVLCAIDMPADWIADNLPRGHNLPSPVVLGAQVATLQGAVLELLQGQRERYVAYVRDHPPTLEPIATGVLLDLPPETALTYHGWLAGVIQASDEGNRREWADLLRGHLREAIGTGGVAGLKALGLGMPGFGTLTQKAAGGLLRRIGGFAVSRDAGARALYRAVEDRARTTGIRGAVLRDGAGRPVAAATYRTIGRDLTVRYLGALDSRVPGSGVQMVRELAAIAATRAQGIVLWASVEAEAIFGALGFRKEPDGRFALSAASALALAQTPPGSLAAWTRAGWLEGPETILTQGTAEDLVTKAIAPLGSLAFGRGVAVLRDTKGALLATARYEFPQAGGDLVLLDLWIAPKAPPTIGRQMVQKLAAAAAQHGRGIRAAATTGNVVSLLERLGMAKPAGEYGLTATEAAAMASGLTQRATFLGQLSWELAVAGASDYLENLVIPGVVDQVSATTHQQLIDALVEGLGKGESVDGLIARIRNLDETTFGLARAERIARTEVLTANRSGAYHMGLDAGCTEKEWRSRLARNTRDWHRAAHGQRKPYREPFVVVNRKGVAEKLMFPGDRSLGAGPDNTIQCACFCRKLRPRVSDDAAYDEHGLAGAGFVGSAIAAMPETVGKRAADRLAALRHHVDSLR
jgi:hypothetical protein